MEDAKQLGSWWQSLLAVFGPVFTRPGWVRFVQWVTGMVMAWEEHTITQILISLALKSRGRAMEHFAEDGAWNRPAVERRTISLIEQECPARWGGYHPVSRGRFCPTRRGSIFATAGSRKGRPFGPRPNGRRNYFGKR